MKLYIVRHGETDWNKTRKLQGRTNTMLNENGRALARETSENISELNLDLIYHSPLERAKETAVILRKNREIPLLEDHRLVEASFGEAEGTTPEERDSDFEYFFTAPEKYVAKNGAESFEELIERAKDFLESVIFPLSEEKPDYNVMLVGHGAMNRALIAVLNGYSIKDFWKGSILKNLNVTIFEVTGRNAVMLEENKLFY